MILISPAKNMRFDLDHKNFDTLDPIFQKQTDYLVAKIKKLSKSEIKSLMKISDNLSSLNYERYKTFSQKSRFKSNAIFVFSGDTYIGLDARSLSRKEINYSQSHLRILSGLYGIIRPLDNIQPYRLEMGCTTNSFLGKSLYEYWTDVVTSQINLEITQKKINFLFNLASIEYFKCINRDKVLSPIITPIFYQNRGGELKNIGIISKKSRGRMARYIIKNKINNPQDLQKFSDDGYKYESFDNKTGNIVFIKN